MRNECVLMSDWEGKAARKMPAMRSRVRKEPSASINRGKAGEDCRIRAKCHRAETGQRGELSAKKGMLAPLANLSVLDMGRKRAADEQSELKERWERSNVEGERVVGDGEQYSEERRRPKKAEETAAQSMRAS